MKLFDSSGKKAGRHSASSKGAAPKAKPEKKKVSQRAAQKRETEDFNRRMAESLGYSPQKPAAKKKKSKKLMIAGVVAGCLALIAILSVAFVAVGYLFYGLDRLKKADKAD